MTQTTTQGAEYSYAMHEEDVYTGGYDSREDAVAEGMALAVDIGRSKFWTGCRAEYVARVDAAALLDQMGEAAYDEVGEACDGWLTGVPREQIADLSARLTSIVTAWMMEYGHLPNFWRVIEVQEHAVAALASSDSPESAETKDGDA